MISLHPCASRVFDVGGSRWQEDRPYNERYGEGLLVHGSSRLASAHRMRHRRVTTWLAVGTDGMKVKEPMGHADLRTTMDYTHLMWENLRGFG